MLPFVDRRRERRLVRRPVAVVAALLVIASMGILTYKGATAKESLGSENLELVPSWVEAQELSEKGAEGAKLFAESGCLNCHTYLGAGSSNLGAPDLSEEGNNGRGVEFQIAHLKCPSCVTPGSPMPPYPNLTDEQYQQARRVPRGIEGRRAAGASAAGPDAVNVFVGITGASGAPYAARLLRSSRPRAATSASASPTPASRCARPSSTATSRSRART